MMTERHSAIEALANEFGAVTGTTTRELRAAERRLANLEGQVDALKALVAALVGRTVAEPVPQPPESAVAAKPRRRVAPKPKPSVVGAEPDVVH